MAEGHCEAYQGPVDDSDGELDLAYEPALTRFHKD
jgi:hypothetical protein